MDSGGRPAIGARAMDAPETERMPNLARYSMTITPFRWVRDKLFSVFMLLFNLLGAALVAVGITVSAYRATATPEYPPWVTSDCCGPIVDTSYVDFARMPFGYGTPGKRQGFWLMSVADVVGLMIFPLIPYGYLWLLFKSEQPLPAQASPCQQSSGPSRPGREAPDTGP
jgi:hypothetical protein